MGTMGLSMLWIHWFTPPKYCPRYPWYLCVCACSVMSEFLWPHQAPLSMGFSRQEYWSGLPFPSLGIFPTRGWNPSLQHCRQILNHWTTRNLYHNTYQILFKLFVYLSVSFTRLWVPCGHDLVHNYLYPLQVRLYLACTRHLANICLKNKCSKLTHMLTSVVFI